MPVGINHFLIKNLENSKTSRGHTVVVTVPYYKFMRCICILERKDTTILQLGIKLMAATKQPLFKEET